MVYWEWELKEKITLPTIVSPREKACSEEREPDCNLGGLNSVPRSAIDLPKVTSSHFTFLSQFLYNAYLLSSHAVVRISSVFTVLWTATALYECELLVVRKCMSK